MRLAKLLSCGSGRFHVFGLALVLLLQLATFSNAAPALEDIDLPMKFVVVRSSSPNCEPSCPQWIWARGSIEPGTAAAFKKFLKKTVGNRRLPVVISSPGGDIDSAMAMGRMIRERKLDVGVGSAYLTGCPVGEKDCKAGKAKSGMQYGVIVDYGQYCNSACPLVLAGGIGRFAGPTTYVGVHQITTTVTRENIRYREKYKVVKGKKRVVEKKIVSRKTISSYQTTKLSKSTERKVLAYLKEMGVAKSYFATAQATPAKDLRQLDDMELFAMNVTTGRKAAGHFTRAGVCQAGRPAAHCVGGKPLPVQPSKPYPKAIVPQGSEMWFAVVRSSESGCEPDCPEWISAEGEISPEALPRLDAMLKALGGRKLPLVVSSSGGDVDTAIAMGELIRQQGLDVAVAGTVFARCKPRDEACMAKVKTRAPLFGNAVSGDGVCTRACMLLLAAGQARLAGYGTLVGWPYTETPSSSTLAPYLQKMDVPSQAFDNITPIRLTNPDQSRFVRDGLLTRADAVDLLVDGGVCRTNPIPANCKLAEPGEFAR